MINFTDIISRDNKALVMQGEINEILNADKEYVCFDISVSNSGHSVRVGISDDLSDFDVLLDREVWNGYDYVLPIDVFHEELEKHGVIMEIAGKYEFFWEIKHEKATK